MRPLEKALALRKSAHLRAKEPLAVYNRRLQAPRKILELVEGTALPPRVKREARRLFAVTVAAAFESYWREFIRVTVDTNNISAQHLAHLRKVSFTVAEVHDIVRRQVSLGELVAGTYTLQGMDIVAQAWSELLGIDFLKRFSECRFAIIEEPRKNRSRPRPIARTVVAGKDILRRHLKNLQRCYVVRHDTVHDTGARHRLSERDPLAFENASFNLIIFPSLFVENEVERLWGTNKE
jgi:hypothetical protein